MTAPILCRARCGRTLTDPESIARGYGPVCWGRLPAEAQAAIAATLPPKPPAKPRIARGHRSHRLETRTEAQLTVADIAGIAPDWTGDASSVEFVRRQRDTVAIPDQPTTTTRPDMDVPSEEVRTHPDQLTDADFHPEPEVHAPELDANGNPTDYALCGGDGKLAYNSGRVTCPDCLGWYDRETSEETDA